MVVIMALVLLQSLQAAEFEAVSFTAWSDEALTSSDAYQSLINARCIGSDWVAICVWEFQDNISSTVIEPDYDLYSVRPDSAAQAIDWCHALGMKVMLKPMVDLRNDPDHWRGQIQPSAEWFASYSDFINSWAVVAESQNVELFCVGCELSATENWSVRWRDVIQSVSALYSGELVYAANHDAYQNVSWWDALDHIGIDAYFPLTGKTDPTLAELQTAWNGRADSIEAWLDSTWPGREVVFTEVGYQSVDGANMTPWWRDPVTYPLDPAEQEDCYEALLSVCEQRDWWLGAFWWNWETDPNAGGPLDWNFTPQGKPAEDVLISRYLPPLAITNIRRTVSGGIEIAWCTCSPVGATYSIWSSDRPFSGTMSWVLLESGIPSAGCTTTWTDNSPPLLGARYYKVERE